MMLEGACPNEQHSIRSPDRVVICQLKVDFSGVRRVEECLPFSDAFPLAQITAHKPCAVLLMSTETSRALQMKRSPRYYDVRAFRSFGGAQVSYVQ